jgi:ethanolamine utilization microcompartment shell protein EutS
MLSSDVTPSRSSIDTVDISATTGEHECGVLHRLPGISVITEWSQGQ